MTDSFPATAATAKGKRRLVRVTCDVLLPEHYDGADLAGINVRLVSRETVTVPLDRHAP